ncbi:MAG: hypothetical protein AB1679_09755 [Actinomycetota bacterium]
MFKPSRRAVAIAASFALGLSVVGPAAHAGLLGGSDDSDSTAIEGVGLPLGGDLLGGDLLGGLLGEEGLLGGVLGGGLLGGDLLGGGLPLVGDVLGGGLPVAGDVLGGDLLGGGLPLVGGVLGEEGLLGAEVLNVVTDTTLHCDAAVPQVLRSLLGDVTDAVCEPFSYGLLGLLGSL